jgi:hypothetical protein
MKMAGMSFSISTKRAQPRRGFAGGWHTCMQGEYDSRAV